MNSYGAWISDLIHGAPKTFLVANIFACQKRFFRVAHDKGSRQVDPVVGLQLDDFRQAAK
jgi:hypothetical protein